MLVYYERLLRKLNDTLFRLTVKSAISNKLVISDFCYSVCNSGNDDLVYDVSQNLREGCLKEYRDKYKNRAYKFIIVVPEKIISAGGYSLFSNWVSTINYMGIEVAGVSLDEIESEISDTKLNIIVMSDDGNVDKVDWHRLEINHGRNNLFIILTASSYIDGNTKDIIRIERAKDIGVNLFVSFRSEKFINKYHGDWSSNGFEVVSVPFAANVIIYRPEKYAKILDYVFLASTNPEKSARYRQYLTKIFNRYKGVVDGPGWYGSESLSAKYHYMVYSMAKIGLNLHIPISLSEHSEINERAFILAACGVLQISDNALAYSDFFSADSLLICSTPESYLLAFKNALVNYDSLTNLRINSLVDVYNGNTYFHRMEKLIKCIEDKIGNPRNTIR